MASRLGRMMLVQQQRVNRMVMSDDRPACTHGACDLTAYGRSLHRPKQTIDRLHSSNTTVKSADVTTTVGLLKADPRYKALHSHYKPMRVKLAKESEDDLFGAVAARQSLIVINRSFVKRRKIETCATRDQGLRTSQSSRAKQQRDSLCMGSSVPVLSLLK
ncbi:unnamed protein product [Pleuronectes platessa]|uniref:Uncharacterized protein n=1 Tax=Pleuronectes platessa TaxID=8262 RepID=A0A9N7U6X2_PLEPL|nr:unnamed protein product [Pleuronectes platessa]